MVSKRSLVSIAGAILMLVAMAPMALSQNNEPAPEAAAPGADEAMVSISQQELEDIHSQLASLTLRVDDLERLVGAAPGTNNTTDTNNGQGTGNVTDDVADVVEAPVMVKPRAPKAAGDTSLRYADNDPNPKRGLVTWKDRASDEDGYRLYARNVYCGLVSGASPDQALDYDDFTRLRSGFVRIGKADADATQFRPVHQDVSAKLPDVPGPQYGSGEIYEIFVAAFNEAGESKKVKLGSYMTTPEFMCP